MEFAFRRQSLEDLASSPRRGPGKGEDGMQEWIHTDVKRRSGSLLGDTLSPNYPTRFLHTATAPGTGTATGNSTGTATGHPSALRLPVPSSVPLRRVKAVLGKSRQQVRGKMRRPTTLNDWLQAALSPAINKSNLLQAAPQATAFPARRYCLFRKRQAHKRLQQTRASPRAPAPDSSPAEEDMKNELLIHSIPGACVRQLERRGTVPAQESRLLSPLVASDQVCSQGSPINGRSAGIGLNTASGSMGYEESGHNEAWDAHMRRFMNNAYLHKALLGAKVAEVLHGVVHKLGTKHRKTALTETLPNLFPSSVRCHNVRLHSRPQVTQACNRRGKDSSAFLTPHRRSESQPRIVHPAAVPSHRERPWQQHAVAKDAETQTRNRRVLSLAPSFRSWVHKTENKKRNSAAQADPQDWSSLSPWES